MGPETGERLPPREWIEGLIPPRHDEVLSILNSDEQIQPVLLRVLLVEHFLLADEGAFYQKIRILTEEVKAPKAARKGTGGIKPFAPRA